MHPKTLAVALVFWLAGGAFAPVSAQSLADVARQEESRRKGIKQPTKVMTNRDLGNVPPSTPSPAPTAKGAQDAATGTVADKDSDAARDVPDSGKATGEPAKGQAYWSGRMKDLQAQVDRDQTLADALQSRVNALLTDFVSRSDPAQRSTIERDRQKALGELEGVRQSLQKNKKAIADLQEEARRAGVPAGWLR